MIATLDGKRLKPRELVLDHTPAEGMLIVGFADDRRVWSLPASLWRTGGERTFVLKATRQCSLTLGLVISPDGNEQSRLDVVPPIPLAPDDTLSVTVLVQAPA